MGLGSKVRSAVGSKDVIEPHAADIEAVDTKAGSVADPKETLQLPDANAQDGVQAAQAMALSWSKWSLIAVFAKYVPFCRLHIVPN